MCERVHMSKGGGGSIICELGRAWTVEKYPRLAGWKALSRR